MPSREAIVEHLIAVLVEIQEVSGRAIPPMDVNLRPLCDLDGFESINAVEATVMLADRLELPDLDDMPFSPPKGHQGPLTIGEIADQILRKAGAGK